MVEVPCNNAIKLVLLVLAPFNGSPSHIGGSISVDPLLAKHHEEGREEGGCKTCKEYGLDMNNGVRRTSPLREGGRVVAKGGVIDLVDKNAEESSSLVVRVQLELRVDLDYECRGNGREQTRLRPLSAHVDKNLMWYSQRSVLCSNPHHTSL